MGETEVVLLAASIGAVAAILGAVASAVAAFRIERWRWDKEFQHRWDVDRREAYLELVQALSALSTDVFFAHLSGRNHASDALHHRFSQSLTTARIHAHEEVLACMEAAAAHVYNFEDAVADVAEARDERGAAYESVVLPLMRRFGSWWGAVAG
jgi:hypothetical protein